jgi:hypothetical protein
LKIASPRKLVNGYLCTPQLAFFMIHASRGMKAARQLLEPFTLERAVAIWPLVAGY